MISSRLGSFEANSWVLSIDCAAFGENPDDSRWKDGETLVTEETEIDGKG